MFYKPACCRLYKNASFYLVYCRTVTRRRKISDDISPKMKTVIPTFICQFVKSLILHLTLLQQIGNLTVDTESKFQPRGGDKEKGFKFDLTTGKRLNTFKVCSLN